MSKAAVCINDALPVEIVEKILLLSAKSMPDALRLSSTCRLWRQLIFNPTLLARYWTFDENHRRRGLAHWWNFDGTAEQPNSSFAKCAVENCFLGKSVLLEPTGGRPNMTEEIPPAGTLDRGEEYSVAFWLHCPETSHKDRCVFMVADTDWDYTRSAGVGIDADNSFSIAFTSTISQRLVKSDVRMQPNQWFHIALVQRHEPTKRLLQQDLWVNGQRVLTTEVPPAAYSTHATVCFSTYDYWKHSLADISIWSRRLAPLEIRAISAQKTSIDKTNVPKHIVTHFSS